MINSIFQLDIPKRTLHCASKGERLSPGMEIYSLLLEESPKNLIRKDFCPTCWSESQEAKNQSQVYWKSKIELRKPDIESSKTSRALSLLREFKKEENIYEAEIFVLALFLAHARQIALRKEFHKEGMTYYLYEVMRQEEYFTIKVLNLTSTQLAKIQQFLADKLKT